MFTFKIQNAIEELTDLAARAHTPIIKRTLKIAEPTMVPVPISDLAISTPIIEVNSSGADVPAFR